MHNLIEAIENKQKKAQVVAVQSGDTVKVHQRIKEGSKERTQVFQGLVIRVDRKNSLSSRITVRRVASGVGVEKSFLLHSPFVEKVEVVKRSKVRRNYLSYMRARTGKSARLTSVDFDQATTNAANDVPEPVTAPAKDADASAEVEAAPADDTKASEAPAATDQDAPADK